MGSYWIGQGGRVLLCTHDDHEAVDGIGRDIVKGKGGAIKVAVPGRFGDNVSRADCINSHGVKGSQPLALTLATLLRNATK